MERRSRETPFEHAIKQEGKYDSLEQVVNPRINFAEHSSQQNFSVAKAKSMDDSNVTRGAAYNSSRPENVTEYAKRKGLDPELVKSHSFLMVLASARKIYSAVADLRTQNKALDSRLCRHLVWGIWTEALRKQDFDSDSFIEDTFTTFGLGAEHLATFQVFFANLIRSVRTAYSRSPPEQAVHSNLARIVATIFPNVDEGSSGQESHDLQYYGEDANMKRMRTRSSFSSAPNLTVGLFGDYGNVFAEEEQDAAADLSVTGVNNNFVDGFTEDWNTLIPSLTSRLERLTRAAHVAEWEQECLFVLATGLQKQLTNLLDRAKDIACKRVLESEIMSHLQQNEKQDPSYELEEIRKEELRQVEAVMEANKKRNEEEEEGKDSQRVDSSNKRKASDSQLELGEKRSRKRSSGPVSSSDTLQKTNEALSSSIQGLLKKRREQARLTLLKQSSDTKTHIWPSHEHVSDSKRLFKTEPERTNISISTKDIIFVLERDAVCRKSTWFYNKYNSLGTQLPKDKAAT